MVKGERPSACFAKIAGQDAGTQWMLRARTGVDGDSCSQELGIAADEELRHSRETHDDIAYSKHDGAFEKAGEKTVNYLETLADKIGDRREYAKLKQTEAELLHHHGKDNGCDAVLEMIERVAATDEADGETFLPLGCFEGLRSWVGAGAICQRGVRNLKPET